MSFAVACDDRHAYVGNGAVLQIYRITNPAHPILLGEVLLDGLIMKIVLSPIDGRGYYAFVAASRGGLAIVDVSDPTHPSVTGRFATYWMAWGVAVKGHYAFVGDGENYYTGGHRDLARVAVVDVSNPHYPNSPWYWKLFLPGVWRGLAIHGNYLFVTDGPLNARTLEVIDIHDPPDLHVVNTIPLPVRAENLALQVLEGRVYAYTCDEFDPCCVVEVTNPLRPVMIGPVIMGAVDIAFSGRKAYAAGLMNGTMIFDVQDPGSPKYLGWLWYGGWGNYDVRAVSVAAAADGFILIANYTLFSVADVRIPAWPEAVADLAMGGWSIEIAVKGTTVFVSSGLGAVKILDFSDPMAPRLLASIVPRGEVNEMVMEGDLLYMADNPYIGVYDVSEPSMPHEVGYYYTDKTPRYITKQGDYLYAACWGRQGDTLIVIDVSDPGQMRLVGFLEFDSEFQGIAVMGEYAYLADNQNGLRVVDISHPEQPKSVWIQGGISGPMGVSLFNQRAYLTNWGHLYIFSLEDPEKPKYIGGNWYVAHGGVAVTGFLRNMLFVSYQEINSDGEIDGIVVSDASNPSHITEIAFLNTIYNWHLVISGNVIYGDDSMAGVAAFDISDCKEKNAHDRPVERP